MEKWSNKHIGRLLQYYCTVLYLQHHDGTLIANRVQYQLTFLNQHVTQLRSVVSIIQ
jgi:hypothetical protein